MRYGHRDSDDEEEDNIHIELSTPGFDPSANKTSRKESAEKTKTPVFTTEIVSSNEIFKLRNVEDLAVAEDFDEDFFVGLHSYDQLHHNQKINVDRSAKCTLMKSTFFEKEVANFDDSVSDICSEAEVLKLPKFLSKSSPKSKTEIINKPKVLESEFSLLDICDDEVPEPIDKPEVVTLIVPDMSITETVIKDYRNLADMTVFKGKSFKVGWTKQSTMLCLATNNLKSNTIEEKSHHRRIIAFKKLINVNVNAMPNLEQHLECQYNSSATEVKNGIPYCFPLYDNTKLLGQQHIVKNLPKDNYEKQIWDLIAALFDYSELEDIKCTTESNDNTFKNKLDKIRKNNLSHWIKAVVESTVNCEVNNFSNDDNSKMLAYISGNKINEAAELAMQSGNINLALLISQSPAGKLSRVALQTQLTLWEKCNIYDHIDETMLKIYAILSGNISVKARGDKIYVFERMDWIRIVGLNFWYVIKREDPLSNAVFMYERMFQENKLVLPPAPAYLDAPDNIFDLRFNLLKYYCDNTYPITHILNSSSCTNDPLDYRLSWFVFQTLESLNQCEVNIQAKNHMHINFATQLEQMGLWHWAIHILTYIRKSSIKKNMIAALIGRHVLLHHEETPEYKRQELMIVDKFKIPKKWLEYEKALKALNTKKYKDALFYFYFAGEWELANEIITKSLIPNHLLSYQEVSAIHQYLEKSTL